MKFSSQEEFGLRCLLRIARAEEGGSLAISEISHAEGMSEANVAKFLRLLRLGGYVDSSRGRMGGYALARPAAEIKISEVLATLGGRLVESDFCEGFSGTREICVHSIDCTVLSFWQTIQEAVDQVLCATTLADLLPPHVPEGTPVPHTIQLRLLNASN